MDGCTSSCCLSLLFLCVLALALFDSVLWASASLLCLCVCAHRLGEGVDVSVGSPRRQEQWIYLLKT